MGSEYLERGLAGPGRHHGIPSQLIPPLVPAGAVGGDISAPCLEEEGTAWGGVRLASPIWSYAHPHKPSRDPLRLSGRPQAFLQELWGALEEIGGELPKPGEVKGHVPLRKMESPPTGSTL